MGFGRGGGVTFTTIYDYITKYNIKHTSYQHQVKIVFFFKIHYYKRTEFVRRDSEISFYEFKIIFDRSY